MILSFSRMVTAEKSLNDSAQSPAWSRNALPAATSASESRNWRASPANTSGGSDFSVPSTASASAGSGQSGWKRAGCARQPAGDQVSEVAAIARPVYPGGSARAGGGARRGGQGFPAGMTVAFPMRPGAGDGDAGGVV